MNRGSLSLFGVLFSVLIAIPVFAGDASTSFKPNTMLVGSHRFSLALPWFGRVEATSAAIISARVNGRITKIHQRDESDVHQGDLLMELGGMEVDARRANLIEQVNLASRIVQTARQNLAIRQQMLGEHLSSRELLNATRQALARAQSQLSAARQALATFKAAIRIKAPENGVFTARRVYRGQYVTAGAVLARVVNPHLVRIRASLFPPPGMKLAGLAAIIRSSNGPDRQGVVSRVMPKSTAEGGVQVWIEGDGLKGMAPGMQVSGEISIRRQSLAVPSRAIARDDQGRAYVFVKTDQGYHKQGVETGLHEHGLVEITSGLKGKERVAVDNVYELLFQDFSKVYRVPD